MNFSQILVNLLFKIGITLNKKFKSDIIMRNMPTKTIQRRDTPQPDYLSPEWVFDALMEHINPDLTIANRSKLQDRYPGESDEDRKARFEQYELAFLVLNECLADLECESALDAMLLKAQMSAIASHDEHQKEEQQLTEIEGEIDRSDFSA
jgi:hypothetical protein